MALPHGRDGLSARRMAVLWTFRAPSLCRHVRRELIPDLPSVPVQPVLQASAEEYTMFDYFRRYLWVLETYRYSTLEELNASLRDRVIDPAESKAKEWASK